MIRTALAGLLVLSIAVASGCRTCSSPFDECGPTHTGEPCGCDAHVREGSAFGHVVDAEYVESPEEFEGEYELDPPESIGSGSIGLRSPTSGSPRSRSPRSRSHGPRSTVPEFTESGLTEPGIFDVEIISQTDTALDGPLQELSDASDGPALMPQGPTSAPHVTRQYRGLPQHGRLWR